MAIDRAIRYFINRVFSYFVVLSSFLIRFMVDSKTNPSFRLPEDLIIDILSRLPVKSLIRFKVVCKAWNILSENPNFISKHLRQSTQNPDLNLSIMLVISQKDDKSKVVMSSYFENSLHKPINLDFPSENDYIAILGVCNGLICISLCANGRNILICNPATKKFHKIPNGNILDDCIETQVALLGFGFDPSTNDYKFIRVLFYAKEDGEYVEQAGICSMSTNSWSKINTEITMLDDVYNRSPISEATIDGIFYWAGRKGLSREPFILSFNMRDEVYRVIEGPNRYQGKWECHTWELIQLKEELAMFVSAKNKGCYNVYVLNENDTYWGKRFRIGPLPIIERPMQVHNTGEITVAGFGKNCDLIVIDNTSSEGGKLCSYNFSNQEMKILPYTHQIYYPRVFWYTESLLSVKNN